jgi:hypothetical protein
VKLGPLCGKAVYVVGIVLCILLRGKIKRVYLT